MSMEIITGTNGIPGLMDALNEHGAFVSVEEESGLGDYTKFVSYYVSEKSRLRAGFIAEGTAGDRWIETRHRDNDVYVAIYGTGSTATSNTQAWKIIKFDTGFLFGISKYSDVSSVYLSAFIGKTVDEDGNESMGIAAFPIGSATSTNVMTDNNPGAKDTQSLHLIDSPFSTKLSQVYALNCLDKFKDVFVIHQAPYKTERRFTLNGEYFYTNYYGNMAIRFGGL